MPFLSFFLALHHDDVKSQNGSCCCRPWQQRRFVRQDPCIQQHHSCNQWVHFPPVHQQGQRLVKFALNAFKKRTPRTTVPRGVCTCNSTRSMRSRIQWWVVNSTTAPHKDINYEWMILHCGDALVSTFLFGVVLEVLSLSEQSRYCKRQPHPEFTSGLFILA